MIICWKDSHDDEMYHFGIKTKNGKTVCYASLFSDAVYDLFGDVFFTTIKKLPCGEIVEISIDAEVKK